MGKIGLHCWWIVCALVFAGALSSCAEPATPQRAAVTLTLIPATETPTPQPSATVTTSSATQTPLPSPTRNRNSTPIAVIQTSLTPDMNAVQAVVDDLADFLGIAASQIQLVSTEQQTWYDAQLGCEYRNLQMLDPAEALRPTGEPITGRSYLLLVGDTLYSYRETENTTLRCPGTQPLQDDLLLLVDPIAAEIFFLAQRQVANQLSLSTRRVSLVSIRAYTWEDTSLGCPASEQPYSEAAIDGYRVVVRAADTRYAFHSDSISVIPCPEGREQLP